MQTISVREGERGNGGRLIFSVVRSFVRSFVCLFFCLSVC